MAPVSCAHVSCSVPDFPARVSTLDPLQLPTQILFFSASLHSRCRSTVSRPRRRQTLWTSDACHRALVARNGSWRDFRCSGAHEDQTRFRLMRKQFHSTVRSSKTHFWNEWLGSVRPFPAVLLGLRPLSSVAPSGPLLSHLTCATCKIPRGALSISAPISLHWGGCFLTTSSARCLSVSRPSLPCASRALLTKNSLLRFPSATSPRQVRIASRIHSSRSSLVVQVIIW